MKKYIVYTFSFLVSLITFAQEVTEEAESLDEWPLLSKQILLVIFALICIVFAARTFRGKPDA